MTKTRKTETKKPGSPMFIWYLKKGLRHTTDKAIATRVAAMEGRAPIDFISPKLREVYLKAWPELGEVAK